jgi:hypothetical protein
VPPIGSPPNGPSPCGSATGLGKLVGVFTLALKPHRHAERRAKAERKASSTLIMYSPMAFHKLKERQNRRQVADKLCLTLLLNMLSPLYTSLVTIFAASSVRSALTRESGETSNRIKILVSKIVPLYTI